MKKVKFTSHEEMEADKIRADNAMTPKERLMLCLHLMDVARELAPDKTLRSSNDDGIKWKVLKWKNGTDKKRP